MGCGSAFVLFQRLWLGHAQVEIGGYAGRLFPYLVGSYQTLLGYHIFVSPVSSLLV